MPTTTKSLKRIVQNRACFHLARTQELARVIAWSNDPASPEVALKTHEYAALMQEVAHHDSLAVLFAKLYNAMETEDANTDLDPTLATEGTESQR